MGGTINSGGIYGFGVDLDKLSMTTATDPATNAATTSTIIGSFAGIIITTTTTGNSQTLSDPTDTTAGKVFSVVVDEDSTNSVPVVANATTYTIAVGTSQSFIWNGAEWGAYDMGITSLPVPYNQGGTGVTNDLANYYIWVDGSRSDTYTADGSMARPYKTVLAALTAINADTGKSWVMNVASGTYSDNLTITSPRYLRIAAQGGVVLSGTILINSGVGSYDRIEFVGGVEGCRAEKGAGLTISGKMTCTRTNDSLIYVSFSGCYITGELECTTNGTWVLQYKGCRVEGNIKGTFDGVTADQTILIETFGFNEFATGTISGKTSFYNCHDSDFYGTINTTPWYESRFHHCTFGGSVSIIPQVGASSALIYFDSNSYKSMAARTPTLTGVTVSGIDNILAAGTNVFIGDTSNSKSTQGLTINQGANDDEIISLKSSDVNHSFTDRTEADTYGVVSKTSATLGGLAIYGYSDGDYNALYLAGNMGTTDPTDINGAIEFEGNKLSGTTIGALGAAETVLNVKNRATTLFSVLGDGKTNFWKTANDGTNYEGLQIDPATAGNMQIIAKTAGTGTDNIDITLTPAGTGAVKTGTAEVIDTHYDTIFIPASAMTPTATNGAVGSTAEYATNDINMDYLLFDGATEQFAEFQFPMPENWDRSTIKAKFFWSSDSGSTANDTVEWEIAGGALSNDDAIDAALGTAQVISDALLADNGTDLQVSGATPAITVGGTPALGDLVHFKVSRNVGGTDDMTENARLFGVWIQYKANTSVASW